VNQQEVEEQVEQKQPAQTALEKDPGLDRLVFFCDAIFAIAITLLALDIRPPAGQPLDTDADVLKVLGSIGPQFFSFVISFIVIGLYWIGHHWMFRFIVRADVRLLMLNLLLMLCIAFMPFPTYLLGQSDGRVATIFYALVQVITGLVANSIWWYATYHERLLAKPLDQRVLQLGWLRGLPGPLVFSASIIIALWSPNVARYFWLALIAFSILNGERSVRLSRKLRAEAGK
jgi:uncharacterized membrane protein